MTMAPETPAPEIDPGPQYLSIATIARTLGVHDVTVRKWIHDGKIPVVRFPNRRVAIHVDEWHRWTDELRKMRDVGQVRGRRVDPNIL